MEPKANPEYDKGFDDSFNRCEKRILALSSLVAGLEAARRAYASEFDGDVGSIHGNIRKLKKERDDYKARWEQTGCTRHSAMETAIALYEKVRQENKRLKAMLERMSNVLGEYGCPLEDPTLNALLEEIDAVLLRGE